jgi:hypothetical protein
MAGKPRHRSLLEIGKHLAFEVATRCRSQCPTLRARRSIKNLEIREIFSLSRRLFLLMIPRFDVFLPHSLVRAMVFSRRQLDQDQTLHGIGSNPIAVRCLESL